MENFCSVSGERKFLVSVFALCLSMSWLVPIHQIPWMSFYSDALTTLVLLLIAWFFIYKKNVNFELDALGLAVVLCVINIWFQYIFGKITSFGIAWIYSLYIIGFLLAILIGRAWQKKAPNQCGDFLFLSVLLGSLFSVFIQLYQLLEIGLSANFVYSSNSSRYSANLGQPNQLGSLMILGILACAWFHIKSNANGAMWMALAVVLAFGLAMTGSRTGWLNMVILFVILFFYRKKLKVVKLFTNYFALLVFYYSFVFFQPWVLIKNYFNYASIDITLRALSDQGRIDIWRGLIVSYDDYFLSGYGWGQISHSQTIYANPALDIGNMVVQSHNLLFDIFLWVGVPFGLIIFGLFFLWMLNLLSKLDDIRLLLMTCFMLVLFIHSMLEFPLHYAYFLLPLGIMAGAASQSINAMVIKVPKLLIAMILLFSTGAYALTVKDYILIENGFLDLRFKLNGIQGVEDFPADSVVVLTHLRDYIVFTTSDPTSNYSEFDIGLGRKVVSSFPSSLSMYNLAAVLAFSGNSQEAGFWLDRICKVNSKSQCELIKSYWASLVQQNPSIAHVRFDS